MSVPSDTQAFFDINTIAFDGIPIYGVTSIVVTRTEEILEAEDNNNPRPVAFHRVRIRETVTVNTTDAYCMMAVMAHAATKADLTFVWKVADNNVGTNLLSNKNVTIKNVVWESKPITFGAKSLSNGSFSGRVLGLADGSDPIQFA